MKKKIYSFSLDPEVVAKLQKIAQKEVRSVSNMIELKLSTLQAVKRLSDRGANSKNGRPYDKSAELIVNRLEQYNEKTEPVVDYYKKQNKYSKVNAEGTQQEVFERLSEEIAETLRKNF